MAADISHPVAELVSQVSDHFMVGVAIGADMTAVLDQRDFRFQRAQDVVLAEFDWRVQRVRAFCMHHESPVVRVLRHHERPQAVSRSIRKRRRPG
jgi:hypothetical protein